MSAATTTTASAAASGPSSLAAAAPSPTPTTTTTTTTTQTPTPPQRTQRPRALVELTAGLAAGLLTSVAAHPLDVVKTRLQLNSAAPAVAGGASWAVLRQIVTREAVGDAGAAAKMRALYRGLVPNVVGNMMGWGMYFLWYGEFKQLLVTHRHGGDASSPLSTGEYLFASGAAGTASQLLTNPIWVVKTRMLSSSPAADPAAYRSLVHGLTQLVASEGARGLFRGMVPALFGITHGAVQFTFYEQLKTWRRARRGRQHGDDRAAAAVLSNADTLSLSAGSKIAAGALTYPYQVVRARLQTYDAGKLYKSARDVVAQVWRKEGLSGFYKGLLPSLVRVLPSTCITFLVYENTKYYLQ